jgi:hypothetical protein
MSNSFVVFGESAAREVERGHGRYQCAQFYISARLLACKADRLISR